MKRDPLRIADRMNLIEASGIRRFFDLAQTMRNPINLSIGQAHFDPPVEVIEAAISAIRSGKNRYSVTQGIEPLRVKLRGKLAERFPMPKEDDLIITSGVSGGLMLGFLATLNPGDELLIPDPYFVMYKHLANMIGAKPVIYDTYPDFRLTREALDRALTSKTRALLINSPSNPTGYVLSEAEVRIACDFCRDNGLLLISDEIYDFFIYDRPHVSPRRFYEATLTLGGFSKNFGIPGWRMGYAAGPANILEQMRILQQFSFVCAPTPAQWAVLEGLDHDYSAARDEYRRKRDMVYDSLSRSFRVVKPEGAFYIFPQLADGVTDGAFVEKCIARETLVVPGSACSTRNTNIRVSYAADDDTLRRGLAVLGEVAASFGG